MDITRRKFLGALALAAGTTRAQAAASVHVKVDVARKLGIIPNDFLGLGYEISSVSTPGLLSGQNHPYVQLVRQLGTAGVIRVGGITADYASYAAKGKPISSPKGSVVNAENLRELASFLHATGWKLIWGLNLGTGGVGEAVMEAEAVAKAVKEKLLAFEIGNEPDLFNRGSSAHRPGSYGYEEWLAEYRRYKSAIRAKLPHISFAGPDAATVTDWVTRFAADEGRDLRLLTHHYYRECAGTASTLDKLLQPDPKLAPLLEKLRSSTERSQVPYRICETNSFCGGGKQGVSNTFGSALWALDFLWKLADGGCAGVNMETGVNQLDFVSWYSPIAENVAKPEYYGMLAFAQSVGGERVAVQMDAGELNVTAYGVVKGKNLLVTVINKDAVEVSVGMDGVSGKGKIRRLTAPSLESIGGVRFSGEEELGAEIRLGAGSAAILQMMA